ncbi:MAG: gliding motility-associated C-terminal domain-containing protein [Bacteroidales bacterium]|jgi:gliding motility-associated-like protein|nr:gliding motility-associated C-terminal domain-containing protein [Bacteroidales bacterium]
MKRIWLVILFFCSAGALYATHQKAAEITYRHISGTTYEFTIVTYTFTQSLADRPTLIIQWGYQDKLDIVSREPIPTLLDAETRENRYIIRHTFPGPGSYTIWLEDENRNAGVINMPNSVNTAMYVETMLFIGPSGFPPNSSPILLNKPIDRGCLGLLYMHNAGAFDPDGDSLSYKLANCLGLGGQEVPGYYLPDSIMIDPRTGDLIWDVPRQRGEFNVAIEIEEYRMGIKIGSIVRDMQLTIQTCDNRLPELDIRDEICVFAGDTMRVSVKATDADSTDMLTLSATGGIFQMADAAVFPQISGISPLFDTLVWMPQHDHVQQNPYPVYFRARDNGTPNLNALKTLLIHVIGRAPQWVSATSKYDHVLLKWQPVLDQNIVGYRIYRAQEKSETTQDSCSFGIMDSTYTLLVELNDGARDTFSDVSTLQTNDYCYRIVAMYRNGMESQMSDEICGSLLSDKPILEKVSVLTTDAYNGQIELAWRKPLDFEELTLFPERFSYVVHRAKGEDDFDRTDTVSDTTFVAQGLTSDETDYQFKVELIRHYNDTLTSIGFSNVVTSIFANAIGKNKRVNLQWHCSQPWKTTGFAIYRKLAWETAFDSISYTDQPYFTDTDVVNDSSYTYKIKAFGHHYTERLKDVELINWSQEVEAMPYIDTPCIQTLDVQLLTCKPASNQLNWQPLDMDCFDEDITYRIYYSTSQQAAFSEIDAVNTDFYIHDLSVNVGCYYVVADNGRFQSEKSNVACISSDDYFKECMQYELPNIFTPNDDGINDRFKAIDNVFSGVLTIRIYNRHGNLVFESNDPDFEWDGTNRTTKQKCSEGVYFYIAELLIPGAENMVKKRLSGSITLLR